MFSTPFVLSFALLLSPPPLLFLLAPHFLPPKNQISIPAADEIDDQALFARAVRSKSAFTRLSLDSKTKPKIAFLFLTNSDLHFAPLWQRVPLHSFRYVYRSLFASSTFDKSRPATESDVELTRMGVKVKYNSFIEILSKLTSLWKRYPARGRYAMMSKVCFDQFQLWPHRTGTPTTVVVGVVVSDPDTGLRKVIEFG